MLSTGSGCGSLGFDALTDQVDSQLEWNFLTANAGVSGPAGTTYGAAMTTAQALVGY